jgi:DNA invertase Pin-like site-specific DNA recombinase
MSELKHHNKKRRRMRKVAIYARVSTDAQTTENQLTELRAVADRHGWQVVGEFVDHGISGAKGREQRPEFDRMLKAAMRKEFDVVAAWSVDRLGRSLQNLIEFLNEIHAKKVDLYLHQQGLDTTTPAGKALFQMCGVFAEFERAMIVERVKAGLQRAKTHGTKSGKSIGRPRVTPAVERKILAARRKGDGMVKIAKTLGVGVGTVQRIVGTADPIA